MTGAMPYIFFQYAGYLTVCFVNSKCEKMKGNGVM